MLVSFRVSIVPKTLPLPHLLHEGQAEVLFDIEPSGRVPTSLALQVGRVWLRGHQAVGHLLTTSARRTLAEGGTLMVDLGEEVGHAVEAHRAEDGRWVVCLAGGEDLDTFPVQQLVTEDQWGMLCAMEARHGEH